MVIMTSILDSDELACKILKCRKEKKIFDNRLVQQVAEKTFSFRKSHVLCTVSGGAGPSRIAPAYNIIYTLRDRVGVA